MPDAKESELQVVIRVNEADRSIELGPIGMLRIGGKNNCPQLLEREFSADFHGHPQLLWQPVRYRLRGKSQPQLMHVIRDAHLRIGNFWQPLVGI